MFLPLWIITSFQGLIDRNLKVFFLHYCSNLLTCYDTVNSFFRFVQISIIDLFVHLIFHDVLVTTYVKVSILCKFPEEIPYIQEIF